MSQIPLLELINVSKVYDLGKIKIHALKDVSLKLFEGEYISIMGKSGSGKSTLMHIMGLLDSPTSGKVILSGKDVSNFTEKYLSKIRNKEIGFVFQDFNLLERTSSLDNVILPLKYSEVKRSLWNKKAIDALNAVDLGDRLQNKSNELSGGQKQRVAIARALVNDPSILFADEPTGNLDSKTGDEITNLFDKLHNKGKTVVTVTHDEDLASKAKRRIVLIDGERANEIN